MIKGLSQISLSQKILRIGLLIYAISVSISISGAAAGLFIGFIGCTIYVISQKKIILRDHETKLISGLIILFILSTFISTVFSSNPASSYTRYPVFVGETAMFLLLISLVDDKNKSFTSKLVNIILIFTMLESLYGVTEYFTGIRLFAAEKAEQLSPIRRMKGTLGHWNALGGVLGMIIPLGVAVTIFNIESKNRKYYFFAMGTFLMSICLVLTFTRGAWLGVFCGLAVMSIVKNRKLLFMVIAFVLLMFLIPQSRKRIVSTIKSPGIERIFIWESTIDMIGKRPLFGWGQDTFQNIFYSDYYENEKAKKIMSEKGYWVFDKKGTHFHAHNVYLGLLQETGIAGLVIFLLILINIFRKIAIILRGNFSTWEKAIAWGILGAMIDFIIHGFFDYPLRAETGYLFWFLVGLLYSFNTGYADTTE